MLVNYIRVCKFSMYGLSSLIKTIFNKVILPSNELEMEALDSGHNALNRSLELGDSCGLSGSKFGGVSSNS